MNENYIKASRIMEHYGAQHQLTKLCEECGELIQQAAKCYIKEIPYSEDMIEEIADVLIMLWQFESIMSAYSRQCFEDEIQRKLRRQMDRIREEGQP